MDYQSTAIPDVFIVEPRVFADERGFFMESFNAERFSEATGAHPQWVQDNHSQSAHGVLRGLHFQLPPMEQGKLVRVVSGAVFDVAVDIRRSSPTFGRWVGVELAADNHRQLWIPAGMAHGFLVLSETADLVYKTTAYYSPSHDGAIRWDDPDVGVDWPDVGAEPLLSIKDAEAPFLRDAEVFE
jgi:dTDP-4-dehydrorhamnose 3,5-epimerase